MGEGKSYLFYGTSLDVENFLKHQCVLVSGGNYNQEQLRKINEITEKLKTLLYNNFKNYNLHTVDGYTQLSNNLNFNNK